MNADPNAVRTGMPQRALPFSIGGLEWRTAAALSTTLVTWGSAFVAIRAGLKGYPPHQLALLRYLIASTALAGFVAWKRLSIPAIKDWPRISLAGLIGISVYNLALNWGEVRVTAAGASFIINTVPVLSALLATMFLGENLKPVGWLGILLSFLGASLIGVGESNGFRFEPAVLVILLAAVSQSVYFVLLRPLLKKYSALQVTALTLWWGTLFLLPFLPGLATTMRSTTSAPTLAVLYLGIVPAAIGYVTWTYVLARMPVARTTSFLYFVPVLAIAIGWFWLEELPTPFSLVGGAVAIAGVVVVNKLGRNQGASQHCEREGARGSGKARAMRQHETTDDRQRGRTCLR